MEIQNIILLFSFIILSSIYVNSESPCDGNAEECSTTDYQNYVDCIRKRIKRSADCPYANTNSCENSNSCSQNNCDSCDCNSCGSNNCQNGCNNNECCSTCCNNNFTPCQSNHCCHKVCHANCQSSSCRSSCRKSCYDYVKNDPTNNNVNVTLHQRNQHNITTIINLHNYINNTNNINIPVVLNNTNINNITIEEEEEQTQQFRSERIINDTCCTLISPRQCRKQEKFPYLECFHYRTKICDQRCQAPVIHAQPHEICDQIPNKAPSCHQQIIYIPQPQPRCAYQQTWPYVGCGGQPRPQCEGCYSHYVNRNEFSQCSSYCYDDGYGAGPYYRQGPFYRPGYAHVPSCLQMNLCNNYDAYSGYGGGYAYGGGYGYGAPPSNYPNYPNYPMYGVGYPPGSYDNVYFIETNKTFNGSQLPNINNEIPQFSADPVLYPGEYPNYVNVLDTVPNSVQIEAQVEPHRPQRDAVITIKSNKENEKKKEDEKKTEVEKKKEDDRKKEEEKKIEKKEKKKVAINSPTGSSTIKSKTV